MTHENPSDWRAVPWTRFDAVDNGRRLKLDAQLGSLRIDRVEVEETSDCVTITLYERVPKGSGLFRFDVGFPKAWRSSLPSRSGPVQFTTGPLAVRTPRAEPWALSTTFARL